jgi:hypothetical protein
MVRPICRAQHASEREMTGESRMNYPVEQEYNTLKIACTRTHAHRVLVVDGDHAHVEQSLNALKLPFVRLLHPDGHCALTCEKSGRKEHQHAFLLAVGTGGL